MQAYIAKRVLLFIPTLLFVTVLVFLMLRVVPGDPALALVMGVGGESGESGFTQEDLDKTRERLGTDRPMYVQYGDWIWGMLRLDFGTSYFNATAVSDDLKRALPITLELTILAMVMAGVIAVPLGLISAIKQDTPVDYTGRIITIAGIAFPNFGVAILIVFVLTRVFQWFPPLGYANLWDDPWLNMQQLFFPAIALGFSNMAFLERVIVGRHALKNALLPVVTVSGYEVARLLAGTVIIENIFLIPGLGRVLLSAISQRDFPIVQGIVMSLVLFVLVINLSLDMMYAWLNPRIRYA